MGDPTKQSFSCNFRMNMVSLGKNTVMIFPGKDVRYACLLFFYEIHAGSRSRLYLCGGGDRFSRGSRAGDPVSVLRVSEDV